MILRMNLFLFFFYCFFSCTQQNPAYKFSNFNDTEAEEISRHIEHQDIQGIKNEITEKKININFKDPKFEVSLLSLSIANNKKKSFNTLLELGADPNINNSYCASPLISAIRNNRDCDLYFIKKLIEKGAELEPQFYEHCNFFSFDPINEAINYYSSEEQSSCCLNILRTLTSSLGNKKILYKNNNQELYVTNIIYNCLSTHKNLMALKLLIVDLAYEFPEKIYIDGTVIQGEKGFLPLKKILNNEQFIFEKSPKREIAKKEILEYLNKN